MAKEQPQGRDTDGNVSGSGGRESRGTSMTGTTGNKDYNLGRAPCIVKDDCDWYDNNNNNEDYRAGGDSGGGGNRGRGGGISSGNSRQTNQQNTAAGAAKWRLWLLAAAE